MRFTPPTQDSTRHPHFTLTTTRRAHLDIRKDLESVAPLISRLLSIGREFMAFDKDWVHLKTQEDFQYLSRIPYEERYKVEAVYADGRDMALYMRESLLSINFNFSKYPTLTAIIDEFEGSWVYGGYDPESPDTAKSACEKHNINLWSVDQMAALFRKQENLLKAVRATLQILKNSDLYKMENGIPLMSHSTKNNHFENIENCSIIINSDNSSATTIKTTGEPKVFSDLISAIKSSNLKKETEQKLIADVNSLSSSHQNGNFKEAYKSFMQNISAHITVFNPFLSGLSELL